MRRYLLRLVFAAVMANVSNMAIAGEAQKIDKPVDAQMLIALPLPVRQQAPNSTAVERSLVMPAFPQAGRLVRNIAVPTLTVFKPTNPANNRQTAIIVAPGGGWRWLMIDAEGYEVARKLAAQGFTAIVLKYRVKKTPESDKAFLDDSMAYIGRIFGPSPTIDDATPNPEAFEDGIAAVGYVRTHALQLGVVPSRIGIIGFSAGGIPSAAAATAADPKSRPNFFGLIYGASAAIKGWRPDTPPGFVAVAANDPILKTLVAPAYEAMMKAGVPTELHLYRSGNHGFAASTTGTSADLWFEEFCAWVTALGF